MVLLLSARLHGLSEHHHLLGEEALKTFELLAETFQIQITTFHPWSPKAQGHLTRQNALNSTLRIAKVFMVPTLSKVASESQSKCSVSYETFL